MPVRLQTRLLSYSLIISTIPLVCLGIISYSTQQSLIENQVRMTLRTAAHHAADTTDRFIDERISDLAYLSRHSDIENDNKTDSLNFLKEYVESKEIYSGYIYVTKDGDVIPSEAYNDITPYFINSQSFEKSNAGIQYLSKVYKLDRQKPFFLISTPIYTKDNEVSGVFAPTLNLYYLWKTIESNLTLEREKFPYTAFMINEEGWVVSEQNEDNIMKTNFLEVNDFSLAELIASDKQNQLIQSKDGKQLFAVKPIKERTDAQEQWYVVTAASKKIVYAPLFQLIDRYLLIGMILLIGILLFVYYLTRTVVKPVVSMAEGIERYTNGKVYNPIENTYHELNVLNRAFVSMIETLEQREKEILRTEKLKYVGQLAAGVAHEIRNPITTIRGLFQLLRDHPYNEKVFKNYIDIIIEELNRMNKIVGELLNLSKPYQLIMKKYSITELIEEIILLQRAELSKNNITILKDIHFEGLIYTDRNRLYQVILNIIQNSRDAMKDGGTISILTDCYEGKMKLIIKDNGPGISGETLSKLGTPFFTTKENGTGLGLATSMKIMEELKGTFEVTSVEGEGTSIILTIPSDENIII